jgi:formylglycine-generating enzyme required for sulfatase activity
MATIYLSSTYEDLQEHRRVVFEVLRKSGYTVKAMEDYVASDERPVDKCLKDIEIADVYVGIFAFRYGYIPPASHNNPDGLSVTELEFRHAERIKKPCLTFMVEDGALWLRLFDDTNTEQVKRERIAALRDYLRTEKTTTFFAAPYQLAALVLAAVIKCLSDRPQLTGPRKSATDSDAVTWDIEKKDSPYPGLMHFTPKYAPVFFGRDVEVRTILDRMRLPEGRFILISGNSGVGKSSIVDAGVLPSIERTPLPGTTRCLCLRMLPSQGAHPFSAFIAVLHSYAIRAGLNPKDIEAELKASPERLGEHIRTILSKGADHDALILFMDQMEELFTAQDIEASKVFLSALYMAAQEQSIWVLATIRSDHLQYCHDHPEMLRVLRGAGHYPVGPIARYLLSDLVVKPAQCAGLRLSDTLVRCLIHDIGPEGSGLPLLAFVLNELFKRRSDHELSEAVYEELNGINGAIAHHAASVEQTLDHQNGSSVATQLSPIFQSLVIVNAGGLPTRRRPLYSAFTPDMRSVIDRLVHERLLKTEGDGAEATVSISHEALFGAWPSLQEYIASNKKLLMDQSLLESRAKKWQDMGEPWLTGLASGRELRDFLRADLVGTATVIRYLKRSRRAAWLKNAIIGLSVVLLLETLWLWHNGYSVKHAVLKAESLFTDIHLLPDMQMVPGGSFNQGDVFGKGTSEEQPVHKVAVKSFAIGKYEVTFEEYDRFAIETGHSLPGDEGWGRGRQPVVNVSWEDAKDYVAWLSRKTGNRYRLPTESEWEYAARSGGLDHLWSGTSMESELNTYAIYHENSKKRSAPIGDREANKLGLHDMSGNVWEWVEDCWRENYMGAPSDGTAALEENCAYQGLRGGSWEHVPGWIRTTLRYGLSSNTRGGDIGFRLAQDIPQ